jgi:hypothetical protein
MSNVCVMNCNYANPATYAGFAYSSQIATAPASNIFYGARRSRTHMTAGCWEITSANKGIVLQTAAGVNQTVNIAEGVYTTDAAFLAAVNAALTSETSSAAFMVERDATTKKIKITSDGAGGTIFRLMTTNAAFTAASILGFSNVANLTGALTYTADVLKIHTSEWYRFDLGGAANPTAFGMIGPRSKIFGLSEPAIVKLQASPTDAWASPAFEVTLTRTDCGVFHSNPNGIGDMAYRYWRVVIIDPSNVAGYLEISKVYLGGMIRLEKGRAQFPLGREYFDLTNTDYSESGMSFSNNRMKAKRIRIDWKFLSAADNEALEDFFEEVGTGKPFFIGLDPNSAFSTAAARSMICVKFESAPPFPLDRPVSGAGFSSSWNLREEG